mgnify:CR=1 FL=1
MLGLQEFFSSGRIADLVIIVMAAEATLALTLWRGRLGRSAWGYIGNVIAGAGLVVAFRLALTGGGVMAMAASLLVSLAGHQLDLWERLRRDQVEDRGRSRS